MTDCADIARRICHTDDVPTDLVVLVRSTISAQPSPFDEIELRAILPNEPNPVCDFSDMREQDWADRATCANVEAIKQTADMATFVATDAERNCYGYWHGKHHRPLLQSPIVRYDTEGQFSILPGNSLAEAVIADYAFEDDAFFDTSKKAFAALGVHFQADNASTLFDAIVDIDDDPAEIHEALFYAERDKIRADT